MKARQIVKLILQGKLETIFPRISLEDKIDLLNFRIKVRKEFLHTFDMLVYMFDDIALVCDSKNDFVNEVSSLENKYKEFMFRLWHLGESPDNLKMYMTERLGYCCENTDHYERMAWMIGNADIHDIKLLKEEEIAA